jgi:hypothetical protein
MRVTLGPLDSASLDAGPRPGTSSPSVPFASREVLTSAMHRHSHPRGGLSFSEKAEPVGSTRIQARWSCEWSKEEAETYQLNHPDCMVFHLDCEVFLQVSHACPWSTHDSMACSQGLAIKQTIS